MTITKSVLLVYFIFINADIECFTNISCVKNSLIDYFY